MKHTRIADGREGGGELLGPEQVHSGPNQQVLVCVDGEGLEFMASQSWTQLSTSTETTVFYYTGLEQSGASPFSLFFSQNQLNCRLWFYFSTYVFEYAFFIPSEYSLEVY